MITFDGGPPPPDPFIEWLKNNLFGIAALIISLISLRVTLKREGREASRHERDEQEYQRQRNERDIEQRRDAAGTVDIRLNFYHDCGNTCFAKVVVTNSKTTAETIT